MESNRPSFDFLGEIEKNNNYNLLFPSKQQGLAIMRLYDGIKKGRYPNKKFKAQDIYDALQEAHSLSEGSTYERVPQERFRELIGELKEYFLMYDEEAQLYILKEYAELFCIQAERVLEAAFNPTRIEIICSELSISLEKVTGDTGLQDWLDIYFESFKPKMKSQVDFLDRQVDQSVAAFRKTARIQDQSILNIVKRIDADLEHLKRQNKELQTAFKQMKIIGDKLERMAVSISDPLLFDKISNARHFFPEMNYRLRLIDKRLDRIQPKLRQFFGTLNKPLFNVRAEKFLYFLLQYSTVAYRQGKKQVLLPEGVISPHIHTPTSHFTIFERRVDLFPVPARPVMVYPKNREQIKFVETQLKKKLKQQDELEILLNKIQSDLVIKRKIYFSEYFFNILRDKEGDIELAVRLAHKIIRTAPCNQSIKLEIKKDRVSNKAFPGIAICEMIIHQKD